MTQKDKNKKQKKIIMMIIIIIIIILTLITSCSCTSNFLGKIGSIFKNEGKHPITPSDTELEVIKNKDLKFEVDSTSIYSSDAKYKLTYIVNNINSKEYTCQTSDASIATCYVENDYVVLNPKNIGKVTVTLRTTVNNKIYEATTEVTINEAKKYIKLSSTKGTLDLSVSSKKKISYELVKLSGDIEVISSDKEIATAVAKNGVLTINAYKVGTVKITLRLVVNGTTYEKSYNLTVKKTEKKPTTPEVKPTPEVPSEEKSNDSALKTLIPNIGNIKFYPNVLEYKFGVDDTVDFISFNTSLSDNKSSMTCTFNNSNCNLNKLVLVSGNNTLLITVTAEDGSTTTYKIIIDKAYNKDVYLKDIKLNNNYVLEPAFDKNTILYKVELSSKDELISLYPELNNKKSKMTTLVNGKKSSLENILLNDGEEKEVVIRVTAEDGNIRDYTVIVTRKKKSDNNYLSTLKINNENITLDKNNKDNIYNKEVAYNVSTINITAIPEDTNNALVYINNNLVNNTKNITLKDGDNTITIKVVAENGKERTYTLNVHKKVRKILLGENNSYDVYLDRQPKTFEYSILEDGVEISNYNYKDVKVSISDYVGDIVIEDGIITLKNISMIMMGTTKEMTIDYDNVSIVKKNIKFTFDNYYLDTTSSIYTYDMNLSKENKERSIILNTDLFNGEVVINKVKDGNKGLKIALKENPAMYIYVYTEDTNKISLDASIKENAPTSIPIKIIGNLNINDNTTANIKAELHIPDGVNEKVIKINNGNGININIIRKYLVVFDATPGVFNEVSSKYEFIVDKETVFDLTKYDNFNTMTKNDKTIYLMHEYDIPYLKDTSKNCILKDDLCYCYVKKFIGYSSENNVINSGLINVSKDITYKAMYDNVNDSEEKLEQEEKMLWIVDVPLFYNKEYETLYNIDDMIYPGASGSYVATITNETDQTITINSFTLNEENICVNKDGIQGCLNMSYMLRYRLGNTSYYPIGDGSNEKNIKYEILNNGVTSGNKTITLTNPITLEKGKGIDISIFWEWPYSVDNGKYDKLDTLIGNVGGTYKVSIGFTYTTPRPNACKIGS